MVLDAKLKDLLLHESERCTLYSDRLDAEFIIRFGWDFKLRCDLSLIFYIARELSLVLLWRHLRLNRIDVGHGCCGDGYVLSLVDGFGMGALGSLDAVRLFVESFEDALGLQGNGCAVIVDGLVEK